MFEELRVQVEKPGAGGRLRTCAYFISTIKQMPITLRQRLDQRVFAS